MGFLKESKIDGLLVGRCPTIMRLVLLVVVALTKVNAKSEAIQQQQQIVQKLIAPSIIDPRSETLILRCDYDLHGKELYSVNWYKYDKMLFRYMPSMNPKGTAFQQDSDDVTVDINQSYEKKLTLRGLNDIHKNMKAYEGTYTCEVSMEQTFHAAFAVANVTSAILPRSNPILEGLSSHYQVGEYLDAVCTSSPSLPPAEITFYLNGRKVDASNVHHNKKLYPIGETIIAVPSQASLSMRLDRKFFLDGSLSVSCKAMLPGIRASPEYKSEKHLTLAVNKQRLAQELPGLFSNSCCSTISTIVLLLQMIACRL